MGEWINIKDKLPKLDTKVKVKDLDGNEFIAEIIMDVDLIYDNNLNAIGVTDERKMWYCDDNFDVDEITHWQPLPEPPK